MTMIKSSYEIKIYGNVETIFLLDDYLSTKWKIKAYEFGRVNVKEGSHWVIYKNLNHNDRDYLKIIADTLIKERRLYSYEIKGK